MSGALALANARSTSPEVHRERVADFLREWTCSKELSDKLKCSFFCLVHIGGEDGGREPVTTDEIARSLPDDKKIARCSLVSTKFLDSAISAVGQSSGTGYAKFAVCAYTSNQIDAVPLGQVFFNLENPAAMANGMAESEIASPVGALGQSMRWSENFARMLTSSLDRSQERSERLVDKLLERVDTLEERNMKLSEQAQLLLDRAAERTSKLHKEKLSTEREDRIWRVLEFYGIQMLGKYAGMPQANPIVKFFASLPPETMAQIGLAIPDARKHELAELLKTMDAASGSMSMRPPSGPPSVIKVNVKDNKAPEKPPAPANGTGPGPGAST